MTEPQTQPKIAVRNVAKTFSGKRGTVRALEPCNLEVAEGEFVCILGPSGCGKSTLLRMIAGLEQATAGTLAIDGTLITGPGPERGLVFQEYALFPWLTVMQNVMYGPTVRGIKAPEARRIAEAQIARVGLNGFENHFPRQLSGGMKQRIGIARVWANDPQVLLMDEPFGALDSITRGLLQKDLLQLWLQERKTVLFVTHSVEEAIFLADTIVVMSARPGRITNIIKVEEPRPRDLLGPEALALRHRLTRMVEEHVVHNPGQRQAAGAYAV